MLVISSSFMIYYNILLVMYYRYKRNQIFFNFKGYLSLVLTVTLMVVFVNMLTDCQPKDHEQTECDDYESSDQNSVVYTPSTSVHEPHHLREEWSEIDEQKEEGRYDDEQEQEQLPHHDEQQPEQRHVSFEWCQPYRESG